MYRRGAGLPAILAVGLGLRLYRLETPSLWWDEILVPLVARFPVPYILKYSLTQECHPPAFYLLTKLVLAAGSSDFALRLLPVCLGGCALYLAYRTGRELFDAGTGLFAAALFAVAPLFLFVSRECRPYTAFLVLFLLSLPPLTRFLRTGETRRLPLLAVLTAGMFLSHYMTVLVVACQVALAVLFRLRRGSALTWGKVAALGAAGAVAMLPVLPFFIGGVLSRPDMAGASASMAATLAEFTRNVVRGVNVLAAGPIFHSFQTQDRTALIGLAGTVAFALVGAVTLWREKRDALLVCLVFTVLPILLLAGLRQEFSRPWYVLFVPAALLYLTAAGLSRAVPPRLVPTAAVALCLGLAVLVGLRQGENFYRSDAYPDPYKDIARNLPGVLPAGGQAVFSDQGLYNAVNWYVDRFRGENPLAGAAISPRDDRLAAVFVSLGSFGNQAGDEAGFLAKWGRPAAVTAISRARAYRFDVPRTPVTTVDRLPLVARFDAAPPGFFRTVHAAAGVTLLPRYETSVIPARNDVPGFVEYAFATVPDLPPGRIVLFARTINIGQDNRLACRYRFDDGPWLQGFASLGPDPVVLRRLVLAPPPRFQRLEVRFEMTCAEKTPLYPGGNLESLRFVELTARFEP